VKWPYNLKLRLEVGSLVVDPGPRLGDFTLKAPTEAETGPVCSWLKRQAGAAPARAALNLDSEGPSPAVIPDSPRLPVAGCTGPNLAPKSP
jgi:hypothetical protein